MSNENHDILDIDFATVNEFTPNIPSGVYEAHIHEVRVDVDNKGTDGAQRTFVVFNFKIAEGEHSGLTQIEKVMMPNFASKIKSILGHIGMDPNARLNIRELIATNAFLGKKIKIIVTEGPKNESGRAFTNVSGYEKSANAQGASAGGGLPGMAGGLAGGGTALPGMPAL